MAAHYFSDGYEIRRASGSGLKNGGNFAEEVWPEQAGGDDGESFGAGGVEVVEAVDYAARDAEDIAGTDLVHASVDGKGHDALEAVESLLVTVVAVRHRHLAGGWNLKLEHGEGAAG